MAAAPATLPPAGAISPGEPSDASRVIRPWHPDVVIEPRFAWRLAQPVTPTTELFDAGARRGLGRTVVGLLAGRGIGTSIELDAFFAEPLAGLHDPALLPDAAIGRERILRARDRGE